jgi:hypothetical protein
MAELHISDVGECKLHEEGKLMDFDITVVPQGGMYQCVSTQAPRPCLRMRPCPIGSFASLFQFTICVLVS